MSYKSLIADQNQEERYNPYTKQIEYVSIPQELIDGINTDIQYNQEQINLIVQDVDSKANKNQILSEINLSTEGVRIAGDRIEINGSTVFSSGYDPSTKETPDGAQTKVDALSNTLGDLAFEDKIEAAKLGTTVINGGFIDTGLINAGDIFTQNITAIGDLAQTKVDALSNTLGDLAFEDKIEAAKLGTTVINGGFINTGLINANDIFAQNITATGAITGLKLQSSGFTGTQGWKLDNDGLYLGIDKKIDIRSGGEINLGVDGPGPKVFIKDGGIDFRDSSLATPSSIWSDFNGELVLNNDFIPSSTNNHNLGSNSRYWRYAFVREIFFNPGVELYTNPGVLELTSDFAIPFNKKLYFGNNHLSRQSNLPRWNNGSDTLGIPVLALRGLATRANTSSIILSVIDGNTTRSFRINCSEA